MEKLKGDGFEGCCFIKLVALRGGCEVLDSEEGRRREEEGRTRL